MSRLASFYLNNHFGVSSRPTVTFLATFLGSSFRHIFFCLKRRCFFQAMNRSDSNTMAMAASNPSFKRVLSQTSHNRLLTESTAKKVRSQRRVRLSTLQASWFFLTHRNSCACLSHSSVLRMTNVRQLPLHKIILFKPRRTCCKIIPTWNRSFTEPLPRKVKCSSSSTLREA